ncbi:MAG: hypothetical protein K6G50_06055 [bacterium]|nr:hypothetical protein [bacterium]
MEGLELVAIALLAGIICGAVINAGKEIINSKRAGEVTPHQMWELIDKLRAEQLEASSDLAVLEQENKRLEEELAAAKALLGKKQRFFNASAEYEQILELPASEHLQAAYVPAKPSRLEVKKREQGR